MCSALPCFTQFTLGGSSVWLAWYVLLVKIYSAVGRVDMMDCALCCAPGSAVSECSLF
ncbi:hypothetical protein P167DRAFT_237263 [Morchella conica CCBAS932]|uniref:Uncharacterized protein n=1 Tax=Morchella conica CCBAS932 TaxID=1392247 RepID=A0A3N4KK15_9PEZI|nr:hypothetical protein P167DRAFT_237263 [Morchella conica CCBAS932]